MSRIFNPKDKIVFDQMVNIAVLSEADNTSTFIIPNIAMLLPHSLSSKKKYRLIVVEEAGDSDDK